MIDNSDLNDLLKKAIKTQNVELLPKHFTPKHNWVEMEKGEEERIVLKENVKSMINHGWRITRLSKISNSMVVAKHAHTIRHNELQMDNPNKILIF